MFLRALALFCHNLALDHYVLCSSISSDLLHYHIAVTQKKLRCVLLWTGPGEPNRVEMPAGQTPHFRSPPVQDISRWQENPISPIPRLNICSASHILARTHPSFCPKDEITTKNLSKNLTWKRKHCHEKESSTSQMSWDFTSDTLGQGGWMALHGISSFTITITITTDSAQSLKGERSYTSVAAAL